MCVLFFRVAADALRILLARAQLDEVLKRLDEDKAWDAIKEPNTHVTGVTLLARSTQQAADIMLKICFSHSSITKGFFSELEFKIIHPFSMYM